jgi:hypothetical protein
MVVSVWPAVSCFMLKFCFDARLEHSLDEMSVRKAVNEVGAMQALWHFGGEFDRGAAGITVKGDEKALVEALGLFDIGYQGYAVSSYTIRFRS